MHAIVQWWRNTPKSVRTMCWISIPSGIALAAVGSWGDGRGWWSGHGFLANLVSTLAGSMVGIPVALAILTHLGRSQAEAFERFATLRRSVSALTAFRQAVLSGVAAPPSGGGTTEVERLRDMAGEIARQAQDIENGSPTYVHTIAALQARFETEAGAVFEVSSEEIHATWVGEIRLRWDIVHNEVRPRATDAGLAWFTAAQMVEIRRLLATLSLGLPRWCGDQRDGLRSIGRSGMGSDRLRHSSGAARNWLNNFRDLLILLNDVESYRIDHDDALTNGF